MPEVITSAMIVLAKSLHYVDQKHTANIPTCTNFQLTTRLKSYSINRYTHIQRFLDFCMHMLICRRIWSAIGDSHVLKSPEVHGEACLFPYFKNW